MNVSSPTTSSLILKSFRHRQGPMSDLCCSSHPLALQQSLTKSVEPIANFKPRGKCIRLIARVVAQTSVRRWRIDFKFSELVVGELTLWQNDRLPSSDILGYSPVFTHVTRLDQSRASENV